MAEVKGKRLLAESNGLKAGNATLQADKAAAVTSHPSFRMRARRSTALKIENHVHLGPSAVTAFRSCSGEVARGCASTTREANISHKEHLAIDGRRQYGSPRSGRFCGRR
jgi:hypothetical protein